MSSDLADLPRRRLQQPLLFGHRAPDVCNGAEPALGKIAMVIEFINTAPGDPLPDLLQLVVLPLPGQEGPFFFATRARAKGALREAASEFLGEEIADGTPGQFDTTQRGLFMTGFMGAVEDGFPVERIKLKVVGQ